MPDRSKKENELLAKVDKNGVKASGNYEQKVHGNVDANIGKQVDDHLEV